MNYYNEFDPFAAGWLRNLISAGAVPPGEVDERSITDVQPNDLAGYRQCHFFAGIGGWSLALRLAGIPDDYPIWTGSCPCQPYSAAGKGKGDKDERNLWPEFFRLIREFRPIAVAGEQVAAAIRHGWLDGISADLEGEGYAVGSAVLGAHSVGAPHIRQRLYWVADSAGDAGPQQQREPRICARREAGPTDSAEHPGSRPVAASSLPGIRRVASAGELPVLEQGDGTCFACGHQFDVAALGKYGCPDCRGDGLGEPIIERLEGHAGDGGDGSQPGRLNADPLRPASEAGGAVNPWSDFDIVHCRDGKARRVGRGVFPLVDGLPADLGRRFPELRRLLARARSGRTGRLKGYGNAIVPQVAAEFVRAWMGAAE